MPSATGAFRGAHQGAFTMPKLSPELLSVLRCPVTGSALVQEGDELVTVTADESGTKLRYRIEDGIPAAAAAGTPARRHAAGPDQHDAGLNDSAVNDSALNDSALDDSAQRDSAPRHAAE